MKLAILQVANIDVGDRARIEYGDLDELAHSIKERGLILPIAVSIHPEIKDAYLLAAGGRRLAAHHLLNLETIACRVYDHILTPLELMCIELAENYHRKDHEYEEEANLTRKIHNLQIEIYGEKVSTSPDDKGASMRTTAELMGVSHAKVSTDIALAETMDAFPEVEWAKVKNRSEAMKIKKKIDEGLTRRELAIKAQETLGTKDTFKRRLADAFIVGDFFELVKSIPDNSIDLVELDPPYAIDLANQKKVDKDVRTSNYNYSAEGYNEVSSNDYSEFMQSVFRECYRVMSSNSWLLCWFGPEPWFEPMYDWLKAAGFDLRRMPALWVKGEDASGEGLVERTSGQANNPSIHLASSYEMFFYAKKGKPVLGKPGHTNVFGYKPVPPTQKIHPTERPIELIDDILTTFGRENNRVLVPFAGSGNTILSAAKNKMIALGFDLGQQFKDDYVIRVNEIFS